MHKSKNRASFLASLSLDSSDPRCDPAAVKYINDFEKHRDELVKELYKRLNKSIFSMALPSDMEIRWNSRLTSTAAYSALFYEFGKRKARIELGEKILNSPERLRDILIHEMCHCAGYLTCDCDGKHGPVFKTWASQVRERCPDIPPVATYHTYSVRSSENESTIGTSEKTARCPRRKVFDTKVASAVGSYLRKFFKF